MSGFPSLQPAMTVHVEIAGGLTVGASSRGSHLTVVPMTGGSIKTEPGFEPAIDAVWHGSGNDYIHTDPSGKHNRLDAHGVVKDKSGSLIYLHYTGIIDMSEGVGKIFAAAPDAATTDFGDAFIEMRFETGDEKLKGLEHATFVGAGRFILEQGKPVTVEYKLSKVVK